MFNCFLQQVPSVRHVNLGHACISLEAFDKLSKYFLGCQSIASLILRTPHGAQFGLVRLGLERMLQN